MEFTSSSSIVIKFILRRLQTVNRFLNFDWKRRPGRPRGRWVDQLPPGPTTTQLTCNVPPSWELAILENRVNRVGHGLDQSMDWIGLRGKNVTSFLISNHCSTVDAVSYKLW